MLALAVSVIGLWVIAPLCLFLIGKVVKVIADRRIGFIGFPVDRAVILEEHRLRLANGQQ